MGDMQCIRVLDLLLVQLTLQEFSPVAEVLGWARFLLDFQLLHVQQVVPPLLDFLP
ncbi:hypothetical protein MANES_13G091940v8 [Manihot esculenta]|uniref:Uncharacterized protein n=1 Tax=Manihot esculenta TaxID=3983 RepID=A0ACB7GQK7_MANES|nr:hypothetical protein MANES_13G091940v8 [Manihot esculenta]